MSPTEISGMTLGMAVSVLSQKRVIVYEEFKIEEERIRKLCFYGSSWMDHKGKTSSDLYPLPWEGKDAPAVDKGVAEVAAIDLQERLNASGGDIKKAAPKGSGFSKMFE